VLTQLKAVKDPSLRVCPIDSSSTATWLLMSRGEAVHISPKALRLLGDRVTALLEPPPPWLQVDWSLRHFGLDRREAAKHTGSSSRRALWVVGWAESAYLDERWDRSDEGVISVRSTCGREKLVFRT
jgi:hypothetical protein